MTPTQAIKILSGATAGECNLPEEAAGALLAAMLDGGLRELELGAALALLERKPVTRSELIGYFAAMAPRCSRLRAPSGRTRPVVFASYHGMRATPQLLPLVALALQRLGVPVLVHGALDGAGGIAAAYVFRELGILPCASLAQVQARIEERRVAFAPGPVIAPGLAELLAVKGRLGFSGFVHAIAALMAPFGGEALHVMSANGAMDRGVLREGLAHAGWRALLLDGAEGEPCADPGRRPRLEIVAGQECRVLFDAETAPVRHAALPAPAAARAVADWTRRAMAGEAPLPLPLVNQLACCLYGAGYTDDINQAKAIVAIETGSLAA